MSARSRISAAQTASDRRRAKPEGVNPPRRHASDRAAPSPRRAPPVRNMLEGAARESAAQISPRRLCRTASIGKYSYPYNRHNLGKPDNRNPRQHQNQHRDRPRLRLIAALFLLVTVNWQLITEARADCTGPPASEGVMLYNTDLDIPQYCDGTDWIAMVPGSSDVTDGLVAHWTLDETSGSTVTDSSGNGNDGTVNGSPTWEPNGGKIGGGLDFEMTSGNYIDADDPALIAPAPFAFSAWMYARSASGDWGTLIDNAGLRCHLNHWSEFIECTSDNSTYVNTPFGSLADILNRWVHITIVRNSSDEFTFYIDGEQSGTADQNGGVSEVNGGFLSFGGRSDSASNKILDGLLDDVRIYNRALSSSEVQQIYNATAADYTTGLVGHWKLDESGNVSTAVDSAGTNDGTLTNFPADPSANWTDGPRDGALAFDGTDDTIDLGDARTATARNGVDVGQSQYGIAFGLGRAVFNQQDKYGRPERAIGHLGSCAEQRGDRGKFRLGGRLRPHVAAVKRGDHCAERRDMAPCCRRYTRGGGHGYLF